MKKNLHYASKDKLGNVIKLLFLFILLIFCDKKINAQAGTLDSSFGNNGAVILKQYAYGMSSVIQPDGKIVLFYEGNTGAEISRLNPDGSFDHTFGINGRAYFKNPKIDGAYSKIAIQNDGKLVFICEYATSGTRINVGVVRCNSDGSPDSSFGINGLDTVKITHLNYAQGLVIQPDGKILVAGDARPDTYVLKHTFLFRLMPNGGLDPGFGDSGIINSWFNNYVYCRALLIRPEGKIVKGGTYNYYGPHPSYQLESFKPDGKRDKRFGNSHVSRFVFGYGQSQYYNNELLDMALQQDGKIVCTGMSGPGNHLQMAVCRFNVDGSVDSAFGENGGVLVPLIGQYYSKSVTIQNDGKIIICGQGGPGNKNLTLVRFTSNGDYDHEFGDNGISLTNIDDKPVSGDQVHILQDGKILVCGSQGSKILIARFLANNEPVEKFNEVKAIQVNSGINISLQTGEENGIRNYTIERSNNKINFQTIDTFPAKGGKENAYSYSDKNSWEGMNYYRIKENAANGSFTYSQILKVNFANSVIISLYPNPTKNIVTITGLNNYITSTIRVLDINGREVMKKDFTHIGSPSLNISKLAQGSYFLLVEQGGKVVKLRVIKE
ncbi:MAG: T9SS type A sorting domain-containing protein [Bacteroidota bacterium]